MSDMKRIIILWPNVSDGLGGVHKKDERPVLPAATADAMVACGAAAHVDGDREESKRRSDAITTAREAQTQKERAENVMRNHDNLTPAERQAAYDRIYEDKKWPESNSTSTQKPGSSQPTKTSATTGSRSTTARTPAAPSTSTKPSRT